MDTLEPTLNHRPFADRWLRADLARFVGGAVLAMVGALAVALFATSDRGKTALGVEFQDVSAKLRASFVGYVSAFDSEPQR